MSDHYIHSRGPGQPGETIDLSRIIDLGDLVFQVLNDCTSPANLPSCEQMAAKLGVPVDQLVASAIAGTIVRHYTVSPKAPPAEPEIILEA